jgi:hypothetical protein
MAQVRRRYALAGDAGQPQPWHFHQGDRHRQAGMESGAEIVYPPVDRRGVEDSAPRAHGPADTHHVGGSAVRPDGAKLGG